MDKLVAHAIKAREAGFAPYSGYKVGAAVMCDDGSIVTGSNVEVACSATGVCAERVAISTAVHQGKKPIEIAIVADSETPIPPCGICRQFMLEFSPLSVIMANMDGQTKRSTAYKLLPLRYERKKRAN
jgi:homotetrameric cytidine deaminase